MISSIENHPDRQQNQNANTWICVDLPETDYTEALNLQHNIVAAKNSKSMDTDILLMLEHPATFTLGRRGGSENLRVSKEFLKKSGIRVIQTKRGGDITFHGPGQLVVYPIINLQAARLNVLDYVQGLEEVMILTAAEYGVRAERNPINRGVWIGNTKLGSVGIAVRRGVCFHGFSFNVNISLDPFEWMNPCGLQNITVTSLAQELSHNVSMIKVRKSIRHHIKSVFGIHLIISDLNELPIDHEI